MVSFPKSVHICSYVAIATLLCIQHIVYEHIDIKYKLMDGGQLKETFQAMAS